jgi:microcystin-dependent protein
MKTMIKAALAGMISIGATTPVQASENPFIGEIMTTAANFCPRGWVETDGRLMSVTEYTILFSLLGTNYGGNGSTTFALPDLRGRAIISAGKGKGLPEYRQGMHMNGGGAANGNDNLIPPVLVMKTCMALSGVYPAHD